MVSFFDGDDVPATDAPAADVPAEGEGAMPEAPVAPAAPAEGDAPVA